MSLLDQTSSFLEAAATGKPTPSHLSPWLTWLTITLLRQHERQIWHQSVLKKHLQDQSEQEGDIPEMPGWKYLFHGMGCCLTSPTGELIDVDAHQGGPGIIDPWFFSTRIESLQTQVDEPEWQLWQWLPSQALIVGALADLRAASIIEYPHGNHVFQIAPRLAPRVAYFAGLTLHSPQTPGIPTPYAELRAISPQALLENQTYQAYLATQLLDRTRSRNVLPVAIKLMPREFLRAQCFRLLEGEIDATTGTVIETLRTMADHVTDQAVLQVIQRISPVEHLPYPAYQAVAYLLERHDCREEAVAYFRRFAAVEKAPGFIGNPFLGSYAQLALLHVSEDAMPLLRRALRSITPLNVSDSATLLGKIDQPWCHRELESVLDLSGLAARAYVVEALKRSRNPAARHLGKKHDTPPAHEENQIGYTFDEVLHNSIENFYDEEAKGASELALMLRAKYPPEWDGS